MFRQILVATVALLVLDTASAVRVLELVERAVELTLDDLSLPSDGGSTISFSECPTCGVSTHRLTDQTVYEVNRRPLPLVEFLSVAADLRERQNSSAVATVYLDIASGRVTRVAVRE